MRALFISLTFFLSFNAFSSICSSIGSCSSCISVKSSQLAFKRDASCFASLSSQQEGHQNFRLSSTIDHYAISYSQDSSGASKLSSIAASVDRAYQDHQQRQKMSSFYNNLPKMLDNHHRRLLRSIREEQVKRQDSYPQKLHSFKNEVSAIKNNLNKFPPVKISTSPIDPEDSAEENFEFQNQYRKLLDQIEQDDFLKSFPNLTGEYEENLLIREERRNAYIENLETKLEHRRVLAGAEKFKNKGSPEHYEELIEEARKIRRGQSLPEDSLSSRLESFELKQSLIRDKKSLLENKINQSQEEGWEKDRLAMAHELSSIVEDSATDTFYSGNLEGGEGWNQMALEVVDLALGFLPGISVGKDFIESITGKNWITGQTLNIYERGFAVMGVLTLGTSSAAKNSLHVFDKATRALLKANKLIPEQALSKSLVQTNAKLFSSFKNSLWRKGEELNEAFRLELGKPLNEFINPWQKGRRVFEFTTTKEMTLYRVFGSDMSGKDKRDVAEAAGRWLTDIDPSKISKEELRRILNIPDANGMLSYVIVKVPPGTRIRMGVAGKSADGVRGGATQFDLIDKKIRDLWVIETISYGDI